MQNEPAAAHLTRGMPQLQVSHVADEVTRATANGSD